MKASAEAENVPSYAERLDIVDSLVDQYHADPAFRSRCESDGAEVIRGLGLPVPDGVQVKMVADTPDVRHFVVPPDSVDTLSDESLEAVVGGATSSTVATAGTAACSTWMSSLSSASTAGSV